MWIIPLVMSAKNVWMRFVFIWIVMSTISSIIMKKAMEKPINGSTPRYEITFLIQGDTGEFAKPPVDSN